MKTKHETWLKQRLTEGIEVFGLSPCMYYNNKTYYKVKILEPEIKLELLLERESSIKKENPFHFKIAELHQYTNGRRKTVTTQLFNEELAFDKKGNQTLHEEDSELTGRIYLKVRD